MARLGVGPIQLPIPATQARLEFGELPHMFIPFSQIANTYDDELKKELPHKGTRHEEFRAKYFSVRSRAQRSWTPVER